MNTPEHTTGALPEASARDPSAPAGKLAFSIEMDALRQMSMKHLHDFRDVIHVVNEVLMGLSIQPRCTNSEGFNNPVGDLVEDVLDFLQGYEQAAVNVAKAAKPTGAFEIERRAWAIIGFEADLADQLDEVSAIATGSIRDAAAARRQERRAA